MSNPMLKAAKKKPPTKQQAPNQPWFRKKTKHDIVQPDQSTMLAFKTAYNKHMFELGPDGISLLPGGEAKQGRSGSLTRAEWLEHIEIVNEWNGPNQKEFRRSKGSRGYRIFDDYETSQLTMPDGTKKWQLFKKDSNKKGKGQVMLPARNTITIPRATA